MPADVTTIAAGTDIRGPIILKYRIGYAISPSA
jgi:hypothetical protein